MSLELVVTGLKPTPLSLSPILTLDLPARVFYVPNKVFLSFGSILFLHFSSLGLKSPSSVTVTATRPSTKPDFFDRWLKKISDAGHYFFSSFCCFSCLLASIIVDDNPRSRFNCFVNGRKSNKMERSAG